MCKCLFLNIKIYFNTHACTLNAYSKFKACKELKTIICNYLYSILILYRFENIHAH